jgi:hypothetical protein
MLMLAALPLLYLQWQGAVRDVGDAESDPSTTAAYYRPLLAFLAREAAPPFRIEIPFTRDHWESYEVAPHVPLARGWERQLDIADNPLFYERGRPLTPARYDGWLHRLAVRFVALPDAPLDASAEREAELIRSGQPYLRLAERTRHWLIYAVADPTPIVTGAATLTALGPDTITLRGRRPGSALIRVRWSPFWRGGRLGRSGGFLRLRVSGPGVVTLRAGL